MDIQLIGAEECNRTESDIARKIQRGFLAPLRSISQRYDIIAPMMSALDVGGDFYDYVNLGNGHTSLCH